MESLKSQFDTKCSKYSIDTADAAKFGVAAQLYLKGFFITISIAIFCL